MGRESSMDIRGEERRLAQVEGKKKGDAKEKQQKSYRMKYINKFPNLYSKRTPKPCSPSVLIFFVP
jgi:hypothetical protein